MFVNTYNKEKKILHGGVNAFTLLTRWHENIGAISSMHISFTLQLKFDSSRLIFLGRRVFESRLNLEILKILFLALFLNVGCHNVD